MKVSVKETVRFLIYVPMKDPIVNVKIRTTDKLKPKYSKYWKRLVQLNGGSPKPIDSRSFSQKFRQTIQETIIKKLPKKIEQIPEALV